MEEIYKRNKKNQKQPDVIFVDGEIFSSLPKDQKTEFNFGKDAIKLFRKTFEELCISILLVANSTTRNSKLLAVGADFEVDTIGGYDPKQLQEIIDFLKQQPK